MYTKDELLGLLDERYETILGEKIYKENYWDRIIKKINEDIEQGFVISPSFERIFISLNELNFRNFRVLILGQDPYPTRNVADGFAFSTNDGKPIPASLRNVFNEIENEYGSEYFLARNYNNRGNLNKWVKQGVLLLNTVLTIGIGKTKNSSHREIGWESFINDFIKILDENYNFVILSWGNNARQVIEKTIINNKENVIFSGHPSPLNTTKPFLGCNCFKECNNKLMNLGLLPIRWF